MKTVEINLVYPFWVKAPFLIHCYDRGKRMKFLGEWIDLIVSGKSEEWIADQEKATLESLTDEGQRRLRMKRNDEWKDRYRIASQSLQLFTWSLRDFGHEEEQASVVKYLAKPQTRLLPVQIANHKGGILRGNLELNLSDQPSNDKTGYISDPLKSDNQYSERIRRETEAAQNVKTPPRSEQADEIERLKYEQHVVELANKKREANAFRQEMVDMFRKHIEHATSQLGNPKMFLIDRLGIDIIYYDWNLGLLEFTFKMRTAKSMGKVLNSLPKLGEELSKLFQKQYLKHESTREDGTSPESGQHSQNPKSPFEQKRDSYPRLFSKLVTEKPRNAGKVDPQYRFIEDWIHFFKRCAPVEFPKEGEMTGKEPVIHDLFEGKLRIDGEAMAKTEEDFRMPFVGINYFIGSDESPPPLLDTQKVFKLIGKEGESPKYPFEVPILQLESGYNGNLLMHKSNLSDKEKIIILQIWWIWRLGMIYYAGLLRIQSHLIARMGLQLPIENISKEQRKIEEKSLFKEIERLESLQIAIEAVIQESLENNIGDDALLRKIYRVIQSEYRMHELIQTVRIPIPKITSDLRADLEHYKKDKDKNRTLILNYLSSLTVFSVLFSFLSAFNLVAFDWLGIGKSDSSCCHPSKWWLILILIGALSLLMVYGIVFQLFLGAKSKGISGIRNIIGPISSDENDAVPFWSWLKKRKKIGWLFQRIEDWLKKKK